MSDRAKNPRVFLAIDTWPSMDAIQQFMGHAINPAAEIGALFEGHPEVTVWGERDWAGF